ncbi:MAG: DUF4292 domain-containing protein [Ignavibacteria bacterium]
MLNIFKYLLLIFTAVYFISCTASQNTTDSKVSFEFIKNKVNENSMKLTGLDAYGEISIDSPQLNNTGSITVSIKKPDSIFTKLEGPFGIDVANLLITRENFIYYNVMDNRVIKGSSTGSNLSIIMKIKIEFDEIINSFSGKYYFADEKYENVEILETENEYVAVLTDNNEVKKFWIDKENYFVKKLGKYGDKGKVKLEIKYENFYENDGIHFPKKITVIRPEEKQSIWLTYNSEEFNNDKLNFKIKIPKSAQEVSWK